MNWFFWRKKPVTAPSVPFRIVLDRDKPPVSTHTYGVLTAGDLKFQMLELPDLGNQHKISCIPPGVYRLKLHPWDHEPTTMVYEIMDVPNDRSPIDIHPGNRLRDTLGCPLIGNHRAVMDGEPAISDSRAAFHTFMGFMSSHPDAEIEIR